MVRGECPLRQGENVGAAAGLARQAELQHGRHARQLAHRRGGEERDQHPHRDRVTPGHWPRSTQPSSAPVLGTRAAKEITRSFHNIWRRTPT